MEEDVLRRIERGMGGVSEARALREIIQRDRERQAAVRERIEAALVAWCERDRPGVYYLLEEVRCILEGGDYARNREEDR